MSEQLSESPIAAPPEAKAPVEPAGSIDQIPEHLKTEVPVLVAPGWSEGPELLHGTINELVDAERRVICLDHPREVELKPVPEDFSLGEKGKKYPKAAYQRALNILSLIDSKGLERVDVIAHSQGGIDIAIAASLQPEKFRNIVFVSPGGLNGPDSFPRLVGRFSLKLLHNTWQENSAGLKYIKSNAGRAAAEAYAISRSETEKVLKDLHNAGIKVAVIASVKDPLFKMKRIQKTLSPMPPKEAKAAGKYRPADYIDGFLSVKGGHDELHRHPELYTKVAEQLLTSLERENREA